MAISIPATTVNVIDAPAMDVAGHDWPLRLAPLFQNWSSGGAGGKPIEGEAGQEWWIAYVAGAHGRYAPRIQGALEAAGLDLAQLIARVGRELRVADLGCGAGSISVGFLDALQQACQREAIAPVTVTLVSRDKEPSGAGIAVAQRFHAGLEAAGAWPSLAIEREWQTGDSFAMNDGNFHVVLFGHSVCEEYQRKARADMSSIAFDLDALLTRVLHERGVALIIEPVLNRTGWRTLQLRDLIAQQRRWVISGACPTSLGRCAEWSRQQDGLQPDYHCGACTPPIKWAMTPAGRQLKRFALAARSQCPIVDPARRQYFALALAHGGAISRRAGHGTTVMRRHGGRGAYVRAADGQQQAQLLTVALPYSFPTVQYSRVASDGVLESGHAEGGPILSALPPSEWP